MSEVFSGVLRREDGGSDYAISQALIRQVINRLGQNIPVEVIAVHADGVNPTGSVDVRPLVHQQDGHGIPVKHGIIHDIPFIRLQGGKRALICDPEVGDFGFIIISGRDISRVKSTRAASAPGSFRQWDWADAVFIGGLLNKAPSTYLHITGDSIALIASRVTISGKLSVTSAASGTFTAQSGEKITVEDGIVTAIA